MRAFSPPPICIHASFTIRARTYATALPVNNDTPTPRYTIFPWLLPHHTTPLLLPRRIYLLPIFLRLLLPFLVYYHDSVVCIGCCRLLLVLAVIFIGCICCAILFWFNNCAFALVLPGSGLLRCWFIVPLCILLYYYSFIVVGLVHCIPLLFVHVCNAAFGYTTYVYVYGYLTRFHRSLFYILMICMAGYTT